MLALLLGVGLVNAAQVVLLDRSENYFKHDVSAKTALGVADMVSRSFYLRALSDGDHTAALKQPRQTPTDNIMMSIYGIDAHSLPCLESQDISPLKGGPHRYAARALARALHEEAPDATSLSTSVFPHKQTKILST